jgi:hypothetical protein
LRKRGLLPRDGRVRLLGLAFQPADLGLRRREGGQIMFKPTFPKWPPVQAQPAIV